MSRRLTSSSRSHLLGPLGGRGTFSRDLPVTPASGVDIDVPKEVAFYSEASPPPSGSVGLPWAFRASAPR
jgi:hypothetical protein